MAPGRWTLGNRQKEETVGWRIGMFKQHVSFIRARHGERWIALAGVLLALISLTSCKARPSGGQESLLSIAEKRGLTPEDAQRAVKTFVPPGSHDEYMLFASGGH